MAIDYAVFTDADRVNGNVDVSDPEGGSVPGKAGSFTKWPGLSNGQLIALARAWKRAAARSKSPAWPLEYHLVIEALGWHQEGDRFIMTEAHAKEPAAPELLAMFWKSVRDLADRLSNDGTKLNPLIVDWSYAGYEAAAREAWTQMQAERASSPAAPGPIATAPAVKESSGWGGAVLLIALLLAAGSKKKRRS